MQWSCPILVTCIASRQCCALSYAATCLFVEAFWVLLQAYDAVDLDPYGSLKQALDSAMQAVTESCHNVIGS